MLLFNFPCGLLKAPVPQVEPHWCGVSGSLFCVKTEAFEGQSWQDGLPSEHCENVLTGWSSVSLTSLLSALINTSQVRFGLVFSSRSPVFCLPVCSWWWWWWWWTSSHPFMLLLWIPDVRFFWGGTISCLRASLVSAAWDYGRTTCCQSFSGRRCDFPLMLQVGFGWNLITGRVSGWLTAE